MRIIVAGGYLVTEDADFLISEAGLRLVTENFLAIDLPIDPDYDVQGAVDVLFQGLVIQRALRDAAEDYYLSVNRPLTSADVTAILVAANVLNADQELADYVPSTMPDYPTTLPSYPTGLPRFPDSDGGMQGPDGWCITTDGKVVFG